MAATRLGLYGGAVLGLQGNAAVSSVSASLTASATLNEYLIQLGNEELYITLSGDQFVSGQTFLDARQDLIDGLDSDGDQWNTYIRDVLEPVSVIRLSDTAVRVDLPPAPAFNISATETITATVPASILSGSALTASPTIAVSSAADVGTAIQNSNATTYSGRDTVCSRTGFRVLPGSLRTEWTGELVRPASFESRHPQDFVRAVPDTVQRGPQRPEQDDRFIDVAVSADDL